MGMQSGSQDGIVTGINVTPLVDVGLVLVIIFMVTAPLFEQPALNVNLPKASTKEGEEKENITVTITPDGKIAINEQEVTRATPGLILFGTDGGAEGYGYLPRLQRGKYGRISLLAAGPHSGRSRIEDRGSRIANTMTATTATPFFRSSILDPRSSPLPRVIE